MTTGFEKVLFLKVGAAIAKFLFKKYLGESGGQVAGHLTDIGTDKIKDFYDRQQHAIKFEEIATAIARQLISIAGEFRPAAVQHGWLASEDFIEASIDPLMGACTILFGGFS